MKYAKLKGNVITCLTTKQSDNVVDVSALGNEAVVGKSIYDCHKTYFKKALWSLLPKKVLDAKKIIIGKPDMSDDELEVQLELYRKKYADAKAGLDVFEGQALAKGVTQEEYRQLIITKGDNFLLGEKVINDRIELVRGLMEDKIDTIETLEDVESVKNKFVIIEGFTVETPVQDIIDALE